MASEKNVVTRIAPSPTGNLHVGTARSALFNYLFAKKYSGKFIVRIEDTDKERSTKEYEKDILDGLSWLGLHHDELYRQSERGDVYSSYITKLLDSRKAYISKEESKQNEGEQVKVIRLKNPGTKITFNDGVRGPITFDTSDLKDFVIARSVSDPLYHLAVVIDDELMGVTHILRGDDHISNTPRQILIQQALNFRRPEYVHLPLLLASDRSKLSKRKGETSISKYAEEFTSGAMINYLALLGWNPGSTQEIFSLEDLIEAFDVSGIQKGGAIFDIEKLKSINHEYLRKLSDKDFKKELTPIIPSRLAELDTYSDEKLDKIIPSIKERARTIREVSEMIEGGELDFYFVKPSFMLKDIEWKNDGSKLAKEHLSRVSNLLSEIPVDGFNEGSIKSSIWDYATEKGRGSVLWPLRYALTGLEKSPDPFCVASVIGKSETLERINSALELE